jgi:YihY family inner membrane protein
MDAEYERAQADGRRRRRWPAVVGRTIFQLARQLYDDDCLGAAAALAYTTLLALVPLLAVVFAVLRAFTTSEEVSGQIREWLSSSLLAASVSEVADRIYEFLERARSGAVGLVGFVFLLVTAVSLFLSIESAFNRIWRVTHTRPFHRRVITFYAVITLSPALVGLAIFATASLQAGLDRVPFGVGVSARVLPWLLEATALTLVYRLMPHARVRWLPAFVAGVVAAVVFDITKWGFNNYVATIYAGSVRAAIYGSFALVPMFFFWIYVAWIIVLGGVELTFIVQNWKLLNDERVVRRHRQLHGERRMPSGYMTARVFLEVADCFRKHGGGVSLEDVARKLEVSIAELQPVVKLLTDAQLLVIVEDASEALEVIPGRALTRVTLGEVYALPSRRGYQPGQLPAKGTARFIEDQLRRAQGHLDADLDVDVETLLARAESAAEAG